MSEPASKDAFDRIESVLRILREAGALLILGLLAWYGRSALAALPDLIRSGAVSKVSLGPVELEFVASRVQEVKEAVGAIVASETAPTEPADQPVPENVKQAARALDSLNRVETMLRRSAVEPATVSTPVPGGSWVYLGARPTGSARWSTNYFNLGPDLPRPGDTLTAPADVFRRVAPPRKTTNAWERAL